MLVKNLMRALIYEMIYLEPTVYEFANIKTPTLLIFGYQDHTAPGKGFAPENVQRTLGNFPLLVKNASSMIPNIQIQGFKDVGHVPHLESTQQFNESIINFLDQT